MENIVKNKEDSVIKSDIIEILLDTYYKTRINNSTNIIFLMINYIWSIKDYELLERIRKGLKCKTELDSQIMQGISMNYSLNIYCIMSLIR